MFEIPMFRVEKKICVGGGNYAREGQHGGTQLLNPLVTELPCLRWCRDGPPIAWQLFYWKSFRKAIRPFQVKRLVPLVGVKGLVMDKNLQRCSGLMFARVNNANARRVPSSAVAPCAFTGKAVAAWLCKTIRQAEAMRGPRNRPRTSFGLTSSQLHARLPPCSHNPAEQRHLDRTAGVSTTPGPSLYHRKALQLVELIVHNEPPYRIRPATAALLPCAAAEWISKCKASPPAAQMADRCCLATSSAQKSAVPSGSAESIHWGEVLLLYVFCVPAPRLSQFC